MTTGRLAPALGLLALAAVAPVASADIAHIAAYTPGSTEGIGSFSGTITYTPTGPTSGALGISLTNDSPSPGGKLTGFVLRLPSADPAATISLTSTSHPGFLDLGTSESAPPFGAFDGGAALGGSWVGGGNPNGGILVGQTGTFEFSLTASDAAGLSAAAFASETAPYSIVARFRGFDNGGSDKVPGVLVPAPGAAGMLAAVGLAMGVRRRRG